jgi:hypothetical protein
MVENLIIGFVFLGAVVYLFTVVRKQFSTKSAGCAKGCGGACSTTESEKTDTRLPEKQQAV